MTDAIAANLHLRLATLDDVEEVEGLIQRAMWSLGAADYTPTRIQSILRYAMGVDTQLIRDGTYFVVTDSSASGAVPRIVAAGGWSYRRMLHGGDGAKLPGDELPLDPRTDAARIRAFFVDPTHARRGLARVLLARCEREARAAGFTRLELAGTLTGVKFYSAHGFDVIERVEATLPDGVIAPLMRMHKSLEPRTHVDTRGGG